MRRRRPSVSLRWGPTSPSSASTTTAFRMPSRMAWREKWARLRDRGLPFVDLLAHAVRRCDFSLPGLRVSRVCVSVTEAVNIRHSRVKVARAHSLCVGGLAWACSSSLAGLRGCGGWM